MGKIRRFAMRRFAQRGTVVCLSAALCLGWLGDARADAQRDAYGVPLRGPMERDPRLQLPPDSYVFSETNQQLWIQSLAFKETELRCQIADGITKVHTLGLGNWDQAIAPLKGILSEPDLHPALLRAAAHALVTLDARETAPQLAASADTLGHRRASFVEQALARWNYSPRRELWLQWLVEGPAARRQLACECLALIKESQAVDPLRQMVFDVHLPAPLRLRAAQALGDIRREGLEADAQRLQQGSAPRPEFQALLAVELLRWHSGEAAVQQLTALTKHDEPAVVALALRRLLEIDPALVYPLAEAAIRHPDANVRRLGAEAYVIQGDLPAFAALASLLDDVNPSLRRSVRDSLLKFAAQESFRQPVIDLAMKVLHGEGWRGPEQAIILLTRLDHKPCTPRLLELLEHPHVDVYPTAAWGLSELQVPETLAPLLQFAQAKNQGLTTMPPRTEEEYGARFDQMAFIFQTFGAMNYKEAEPLLRIYIPKQPQLAPVTRASAVWALGKFYAEVGQGELEDAFQQRLTDVQSPMPEAPDVRQAAAISLGRMKSQSHLKTLQDYATFDGPYSFVGQACIWASDQITGQQTPPAPPIVREATGWFLKHSK